MTQRLTQVPASTSSSPALTVAGLRAGVRGGRAIAVASLALVAAVLPSSASAGWRQPVGGASPINHFDDHARAYASLAAVGGVPYVAWSEYDGTNSEVRVSRLNAAGTAWEQVVGGASPINHAANRDASEPSLAAVGGVPYVAWSEDDGTNYELRVSRLNARGDGLGAGGGWTEPDQPRHRPRRARAEPGGDRRRALRRLERGRRHQLRAAGEPPERERSL